MKRLRMIVAIGAVAVVALAVAPAASAGPESGLRAICQHDGGTWNPAALTCSTNDRSGLFPSNPAPEKICINALNGDFTLFDSVPPYTTRGWSCHIPML